MENVDYTLLPFVLLKTKKIKSDNAKKDTDTTHYIYEENLKIITGIKFSRRQVDVISCLVNGWGMKDIANRLDIAPSTVETHMEVIGQKIGSGSRSSILNFIEKSKKKGISS